MSRYCDLLSLKRYLGIAGTLDDALLMESINRAESAIDSFTRRNFLGTPGTVYASRWEGGRVVNNAFWLQEDLHTLTSLTLGDGQSVPMGSVWLEPREGPPYRAVRLRSSYVFTWNTDQDMILAGTWGYGTVPPDDVVQATIRLAAYNYRSKDTGPSGDVIGNEALGMQQSPRGLPADVYDILQKYRSRSGGVV